MALTRVDRLFRTEVAFRHEVALIFGVFAQKATENGVMRPGMCSLGLRAPPGARRDFVRAVADAEKQTESGTQNEAAA